MWNVLDLEAGSKTAKADGHPTPVEVVPDDPALPEHGLRLFARAAVRADLEGEAYQMVKEMRHALKRAYWDSAAAYAAERDADAGQVGAQVEGDDSGGLTGLRFRPKRPSKAPY